MAFRTPKKASSSERSNSPAPSREFTVHLPGLLSRLDNWTTCGAGTGFTTDSGMTMEDSGAVEITRGWDWEGKLS